MSTYTPSPTRWRALVVLATAQFLIIMDTSIIGVALPDMQHSLGFRPDALSWVFNAYVIAFGGLLLVGGKLSDIFGARRIFTVGFWILTVASLAAVDRHGDRRRHRSRWPWVLVRGSQPDGQVRGRLRDDVPDRLPGRPVRPAAARGRA